MCEWGRYLSELIIPYCVRSSGLMFVVYIGSILAYDRNPTISNFHYKWKLDTIKGLKTQIFGMLRGNFLGKRKITLSRYE